MTKHEWETPALVSIPEGTDHLEQGKYGPTFPKTPANYGFTFIAKCKPGREVAIRQYGKTLEMAMANDPTVLQSLALHYLKWVLWPLGGDTWFIYQGTFDTTVEKYADDGIALFGSTGVNTVFENLEGFPEDWKTNTPAFAKFFIGHMHRSFIEYGEYPYVSSGEIKKALRVKAALSEMLDQLQ